MFATQASTLRQSYHASGLTAKKLNSGESSEGPIPKFVPDKTTGNRARHQAKELFSVLFADFSVDPLATLYYRSITPVGLIMICHIDAGNGIPIYEQIERQVKFSVANGSLLVGERVPSVRELATQAAVNVNTVARAYRQLQQLGILNSIRGTGLTVSAEAPEICRNDRLELIRGRLRSVLQEALRNQISVDEIHGLVDSECLSISQISPDSS